MKELDAIVEEQASLLRRHGYDEKHLHNGEAEGSYKEHLRLAVQELLERGDLLLDNEPFQMQLFGHFNQQKDKVLFTFSYEYDPFLSQITLKKVDALLDNIPLSVTVNRDSDMWNSAEIYGRVKILSSTINCALTNERTEVLKNLVHQEVDRLSKNGYNSDKLLVNLTDAVNKAETAPQKMHHFIISGKINCKGAAEPMHYRLHYRYHPENNNLQFKSVHARIKNASETFLGTALYPIPQLQDIQEYLLNRLQTQTAKQVLQHQAANNNTKKKML